MSNQLLKALAFDGQVRVFVVNAKELVQEAQTRHDTWHTATAVLGRTLIATSLLAADLKGDDHIAVDIRGSGPVGAVMAEGDSHGNIRGCVANPHVALDLNADGNLDVRGAIGLPGTLTVKKFISVLEPYAGQVDLVSGELGEDFTYYLAVSEQIPSSVGLSVLINPDESVAATGGFMIQVMPGATDETLNELEEHLGQLELFSTLLNEGHTLEELLGYLVGSENYKVLATEEIRFSCSCNKERLLAGLQTVGKDEIQTMIDEDDGAEVICHFCSEVYHFNRQDLESLLVDEGDSHGL